MSVTESTVKDDRNRSVTPAQIELKRAYLHVSFGQYEQAGAACDRAAEAAPEHHLPATLRGSFEMAAGRVRDALATLRSVTRAHPEEPLPKIYFAEACFMMGRRRQAERALKQAEALCLSQEDASRGRAGEPATRDEQSQELLRQPVELIRQLRQTWQSVEPSHVPPPLVVHLDDEPER